MCSLECRERFLRDTRETVRRQSIQTPEPVRSMPERVREATLPRFELQRERETAAHRAVFEPTPVPIPWAALATAVGALVCAALATGWGVALASACLSVATAGLALHTSAAARRTIGALPWALGPAGAILATAAALVERMDAPDARFGLAGAAFASGAMVLQAWLDARAHRPVLEVVSELGTRLPPRVRVPAQQAGGGMRYQEIATSHVRAGEEILVVEGETVAVDGIVQGGEAAALLFSGSQTPTPRRAGDSILAGARIVEGAVRIRATRAGAERALIRIRRFGGADQASSARVARIALQVTRFGGLFAILGATLGLALTAAPGLAGQLAAAAAVLLATPLLAARRSADGPLVAGAASATARGIVFHDARSLELAGRASTAALCTTGTVTEGTPEVVEIHTVDRGPVAPLVALAAGVEDVAGDHPIAVGIRRYAEAHHIEAGTVRRATFRPGRGVLAVTGDGESLVIGNRALLLEEGISIAAADADAKTAEERGNTALFLGLGGRVRAVLSLRDELRVGARAAVQRMFDLGMEVVLLSGDHRPTVEALAKPLDVTHVKAELMPAERGEEVRRLSEAGGVVASIGRTPADDDALASSDVPVVLGAAGGADRERGVATATDDVRDAAAALFIARAARTEATRSVLVAVGVGGVAVIGAALGWVPPAAAALAAVVVDGFALPAGARVLRRVELRVPAR